MSLDPTKVRNELGNPSEEDLSDVMILDAWYEEGSFWSTCARCAEILYRRYAHQADYALMEYRESFSQRAKAWKDVSMELRLKASLEEGGLPSAGGIYSISKPPRGGLIRPSFRKNMLEVDEDGVH